MDAQVWSQWFNQLTPEGIESLRSFLVSQGLFKGTNGQPDESSVQAAVTAIAKEVPISRVQAADILITNPPTYVDIYELHNLYDQLVYEEGENMLVKGPKGDGKSLSVVSWMAKRGVPMVYMPCSEDTKESHFKGSFFTLARQAIFALGRATTAIDIANDYGVCGILLEEVNGLTPQVQKMLNPFLDFQKAMSVDQTGRVFKLQPGKKLLVFMTMNPIAHGGAYELNEDFRSRVEEVELGYYTFGQEKRIIKEICPTLFTQPTPRLPDDVLDRTLKLAAETRQQGTGYALSTRDVERLIRNMARVGIETALQLMVCKFEGDDRNFIITRIGANWDAGMASKMKKFWKAVS